MNALRKNYDQAVQGLYGSEGVDTQDSRVAALRQSLAPLGHADVLNGLPDNADERQIMGRLMEMGQGMSEEPDSDPAKEKLPSKPELRAYVAASKHLSPEHAGVLLARVQEHAYQSESPYHAIALNALAEGGDKAAQGILATKRQAEIKKARAEQGTRVRGCCEGHEF
jgi:hypothetical protein